MSEEESPFYTYYDGDSIRCSICDKSIDSWETSVEHFMTHPDEWIMISLIGMFHLRWPRRDDYARYDCKFVGGEWIAYDSEGHRMWIFK